ncbi:MAG: twin-arginine translocase TatA/TatE family subunit [Kiritimatiellae bacterium]|nr:twin-arginine translocase TatA/TatE family subunit [Kiritimatiellia bacterium]
MALAFIFDSVGAGEWLVLLAVLLVVMGPKRLPATARTIDAYYSKFRRAAESFKRQLMDMDYEMEREMEKARREAEAAMTIPDDPPEFQEGVGDIGPDAEMDERAEAYEADEHADDAVETSGHEDGDKPTQEP